MCISIAPTKNKLGGIGSKGKPSNQSYWGVQTNTRDLPLNDLHVLLASPSPGANSCLVSPASGSISDAAIRIFVPLQDFTTHFAVDHHMPPFSDRACMTKANSADYNPLVWKFFKYLPLLAQCSICPHVDSTR